MHSTEDKRLEPPTHLCHRVTSSALVVQKRKREFLVFGPKMMPTWLTSTFLVRDCASVVLCRYC
jgi:hypothetical protein